MIDHYLWSTPNGYKSAIALAEMELAHENHWVNLTKNAQFTPEFSAISPNNRIPAIVDHEGPEGEPVAIFESGAILQYLARKTGRFMGQNARQQIEIEKWLMWQMAGVGPIFGQAWHFVKTADEVNAYAIKRYMDESKRLLNVLEGQLAGKEFVAGPYSIADMALFPWLLGAPKLEATLLDDTPNIQAWLRRVEARPQVQAALALTPK